MGELRVKPGIALGEQVDPRGRPGTGGELADEPATESAAAVGGADRKLSEIGSYSIEDVVSGLAELDDGDRIRRGQHPRRPLRGGG